MARRQTYSTSEEAQINAEDNSSSPRLVRAGNIPFESSRGRGHINLGSRRVDGIPFVSPRGRGRRIPVQEHSQDSNTLRNEAEHFEPESPRLRQQFTAPDGTLYYSGLVRLDDRPFESPRGRGRNNPGWGRADGRPFVSQRGHIAHRLRLAQTYEPSAPTYEVVMDVDD